jgi:hypothetical protein
MGVDHQLAYYVAAPAGRRYEAVTGLATLWRRHADRAEVLVSHLAHDPDARVRRRYAEAVKRENGR